jgi:hypothetical protein
VTDHTERPVACTSSEPELAARPATRSGASETGRGRWRGRGSRPSSARLLAEADVWHAGANGRPAPALNI